MKPFNLEEYLANPENKVVTRVGEEVEIISTNGRERSRIIGYINDNQYLVYWDSNGHFMPAGTHPSDLFFADEESEDERIRKGLKTIIENWNYPQELVTTKQKILAYLEKQKEHKPAKWSDSVAKEMFIKALERAAEQTKKGYELTDCDKQSWWEDFKAYSLRPQPHWKPSEKQMKKLCATIDTLRDMGHNDIADFLASLYGQLKKLI